MGIFCYQHHINDWRRDTAHLTLLQRGIYKEILDWYYSLEGKMPSEIKTICRMIGATTRQEKEDVKFIVLSFFCINSAGFLHQKRAETEILKIKNKQEKASKSAKIKHLTSANAERTHSEGSANQEPITNNHKTNLDKSKLVRETDEENLKQALDFWNDLAGQHGLPAVQKLTDRRRMALRARLKDCGGLDGWKRALAKISNSQFLLGKNGNGWRADFDFVLQEKSFTKMLEGAYDDKETKQDTSPEDARWKARLNGWRSKQLWMEEQWGPPPTSPQTRCPRHLLAS